MRRLTNPLGRRRNVEPVTFVPVERVFAAQVQVRATRDINGWADRDKRVKWSIGNGQLVCVDENVAREWATKGYVEIIDGTVKPVSEDEAAEILSSVTTLNLGAN